MRTLPQKCDTLCLLSLAVIASVSLSGCLPVMSAREAARRTQSANNMHQIGIAARSYETQKQVWPDSVEELLPYLENEDTVFANPFTGDDPGYEYVKPTDSHPSPNTVILYQLRDGERDLTLKVLFADGHVGPLEDSAQDGT